LILYFISSGTDLTSDFSFYFESLFSNYSIAYIEVIKSVFIPVAVYLIYSKLIIWSIFYSNTLAIQQDRGKKSKANNFSNFNFLFKNLFRNIKIAVLKNGALAYIYLIRIYSLFFTVLLSMVCLYLVNSHLFFFSASKLRVLLVYNPNESHTESLKFYLRFMFVNIVFLFMQLVHFFNYPKFSKTRQVFDSIFILYDKKIINSLDINSTCEKDVLESLFIREFLNFDYQSEVFQYTANGMDFPNSNLSEVK